MLEHGAGPHRVRRWATIPRALGILLLTALAAAQVPPMSQVDTTAGLIVYQTHCMACHQATGDGISAAFPPLRQHVPNLLTVKGGRDYLLTVVLFGLYGEISVMGQEYSGLMPSWSHLSDTQLADVINYDATAWGNVGALPAGFPSVTADDVVQARLAALDAPRVHAVRRGLGLE